MSTDEQPPSPRPVKDAHKTLGLWSIRRALTLAFSGAAVLLVVAWFAVSWLLGSPSRDQPKPLDTAAQLELLKLVFALVAGIGALVALVTAYRRQRVDEAAGELAQRVQAHTEHDATERRVTDLYGQAVEQLGHDKAPVRLGGLYSLERLAQDHPPHRQTITDVICAYLRMPYQPPPPPDATHEHPDPDGASQELQVRLAAQRLLNRHLTHPPDQETPTIYWDDININLTGAHLINFNFNYCRAADATFTNTHFSGDARFTMAHFSGAAVFEGAQFNGFAMFHWAQFNDYIDFKKAQFNRNARFDEARFNGNAVFNEAQFNEAAVFVKAQFDMYTWFQKTQFNGNAAFEKAQFNGETRFGGSQFRRIAWFNEAQFEHEPDFTDATASHPNDEHTWPTPWHPEAITTETARLIHRQ